MSECTFEEFSFPEFMDYDCDKTYELVTAGHTDGVFQLGGFAAKQVIKQIGGCRHFEDMVAVTALCRPGAGKFVNSFREGRANPDSVVYADEDDEEILGPSYGVILYQEQVMALGWAIGMTNDEVSGDVSLLSAIKKYSKTIMDQVEPIFRKRAKAKGWDKDMIDLRWSNIVDYVGYGFNRSHAVAYTDITYRTAYLKANFPAAFIVSRMTQAQGMSQKDKRITMMQALVQDARRVGVRILGPDVNKSQVHFSIDKKGRIRWGLADIKGVGENAARELIKHRPFSEDDWRENDSGPRGGVIKPYLRRVEAQKCNAGTVKALMDVGAFPGSDPGDDRYQNELDRLECNVIEHMNKKVLKQIKKKVFDETNQQAMRKRKTDQTYAVRVGGVVRRIKEITTKGGRKMAFVDVALGPSEYSITMFPNEWSGKLAKNRRTIEKPGVSGKVKEGRLIYVMATRSHDEKYGWGLIANSVSIYK